MRTRSATSHGRRSVKPPLRSGEQRGDPRGSRDPARTSSRGESPQRRGFRERAWRIGLAAIRRDSTVRRSLAVADAIALGAALSLAVWAGGDALQPPVVLALPLLVVVAKLIGLYDRDAHVIRRSTLDEAPELFQLATLTTLVIWLAGGAITRAGIDAGEALLLWALLFTLLAALRVLARGLARRLSPVERCLFVGDPASASEFAEKLTTSRGVKAELVGWIKLEDGSRAAVDASAARLVPSIHELAIEREAQRVVLAPGPGSSEEVVNSIREIRDAGLKVSVLPRHARVAGSALAVDHLDGITLLGVQRFHIPRSSRAIKRGFDVAGSALALVVLSPLAAAIALAIRLDARGPILFRQLRAGRDGRPFRMLKFRSMDPAAEQHRDELLHLNEADGLFKLEVDPRVTRVGRVLRRHSLDELPQLWNVLRGDMSLVGPRPLPLDEDRRIEGWHRRRLDLRPGITGPWQIIGSRHVPLREMANIDNQYVADWSVWNDVRILLLTVPHVLARRGV